MFEYLSILLFTSDWIDMNKSESIYDWRRRMNASNEIFSIGQLTNNKRILLYLREVFFSSLISKCNAV